MIVNPWFWVWVGIFAEVEMIMQRHHDLIVNRVLDPSPLSLYLKEAT